ncbi:MAG: hypothetical protein RL186_481 [Pseudomonadota bacterium]|jgi:uncharacterized protein (TIGR00369 family)
MKPHLQSLLASIPYAQFLGIGFELRDGELIAILPFQDKLIGNPVLPALHGGVVGAMLELTAFAQILRVQDNATIPKTIDVSIDYLRSGRPVDTFARAHVTKLGRRIANVRVEAWQATPNDPIAALHGHFLLKS